MGWKYRNFTILVNLHLLAALNDKLGMINTLIPLIHNQNAHLIIRRQIGGILLFALRFALFHFICCILLEIRYIGTAPIHTDYDDDPHKYNEKLL